MLLCSVVDRQRSDADPDPDPNCHVDTDLDWHQNNADPHGDPIPSLTHVGKKKFFSL